MSYSDLTPAQVAREVAMSREFTQNTAEALNVDYARHQNDWPVSGDHLNTIDLREDRYIAGYGWEAGDVIGRDRRPAVQGKLWEAVAAR